MSQEPRTNVTYVEDEKGRRVVPDIVPATVVEINPLPAEPVPTEEEVGDAGS